jgi:hypothetical protein
MSRRPNECFKCTSRRCHVHIYRTEAPIFDEVSCRTHVFDLEKYADEVLGNPGYTRSHVNSTATLRRGEK